MALRDIESSGEKAESEFNGEINYSDVMRPIVTEKSTKFNERNAFLST